MANALAALNLISRITNRRAWLLPDSRLRGTQALSTLLMLLAAATIIAISIALILVREGRRKSIDWHSQRGLSFFQLGLRALRQRCYLGLPLPTLVGLPRSKPKPAYASQKKQGNRS